LRDHLSAVLDAPQREAVGAIVAALGHGVVGAAVAAGTAGSSRMSAPRQHRAVALVQGPPGTGKTHTIVAALNAWHVVLHAARYETLVRHLVAVVAPPFGRPARLPDPRPSPGPAREAWLRLVDRDVAAGPAGVEPPPRLLVCAPSNGAVDSVLARVEAAGFIDGRGVRYQARLARVGASPPSFPSPPTPVRSGMKCVDMQAAALVGHSDPAGWQRDREAETDFLARLEHSIGAAYGRLANAASPEAATAKAGALAELLARREKGLARLAVLDACAPPPCDATAASHAAAADRRCVLDGAAAAVLAGAGVVFTTLGSAPRLSLLGRRCPAPPFSALLVDEACQASEPAVIPALLLGARALALVGDPAQLRATILSPAATAAGHGRSLFERLAGAHCPVTRLTVQYRCDPDLRAWPSRHFYDDALIDGASVLARSPFFTDGGLPAPLLPYLFFDADDGAHEPESGASLASSLRNEREAHAAVALLRAVDGVVPPSSTAVVLSPYRAQRDLVRVLLRDVLPWSRLQATSETVDGFQGREADIVVYTAVRSKVGATIGHVADVRRLNVALTRARRSLWIVGNAAVLREGSPVWRALIEDAASRGALRMVGEVPGLN